MSCAYWAPKSTTRTGPDPSPVVVSLHTGMSPREEHCGGRAAAAARASCRRAAVWPGRPAGLRGRARLPPPSGPRRRRRALSPSGPGRGDPHPGDAAAVELGDRQPKPGDLDRVARSSGSSPEGGQQRSPPRSRTAPPAADPGLLGELVQVEQAVHLDLARRAAVGGRRLAGVVLVGMSPISSSTRSSRVTMPAVPPYSSTTIARWTRSRRISDSADSTVLLMGRNLTGRTDLVHQLRAGRRGRAEQVPDVHEADHVVVGVLVDRQPRVAGRRRRSRRPRRPWCPRPGTRPRCAAAAPRGSAACRRRRPRRRCAARPR